MVRPNDPFTGEDPSYRHFSEEQLLDACIARQPGAMEAFVSRFWRTIRRAAKQVLRSESLPPTFMDEEDLCQEFFVQMLRRQKLLFACYNGDRPLKPFLLVVARRLMARIVKVRRRRWQHQTILSLALAHSDELAEYAHAATASTINISQIVAALD